MLDFASPFKLRDKGIMGMNQRNFSYIGQYNPRSLYPNVDDKLKTKKLALEYNLSVPALLGVVEFQYQVKDVFDQLKGLSGFAIKPAKGSGGKGILIITNINEHGYQKPSGAYVQAQDVIIHISNILAGLFSLGGKPDVAVIEALIEFDPIFEGLSHEGVPDIRLIVFQGYPVMAMLRLATHESDGKANLHQGAIGVGISIATGKALKAVQFDRPITVHPDTGRNLQDVEIPGWHNMLMLASGAYEMSGLGYLGVDIVLDEKQGPLLLELNARPGLAIQIANGIGMLPRLNNIETLNPHHQEVAERVEYAKKHFA